MPILLQNLLQQPTSIQQFGGNVLTNDFTADTITPNAATASVKIAKSPGIIQTLFAFGTWGSGTITIQYSPDNGTTWINDATTLTANGYRNIGIESRNQAILIRASLAGSTNAKLNIYVL